jgi:glucan-binding YG repeat protein
MNYSAISFDDGKLQNITRWYYLNRGRMIQRGWVIGLEPASLSN